jgi:hypothetical protein
MIKPELFDIIELMVNLPEQKQFMGSQGTIIECFDSDKYEVEFTNENGETFPQCVLSSHQFIIVWQAKYKQWVSLSDKIDGVINLLSDERKKELLNYARFLVQKI